MVLAVSDEDAGLVGAYVDEMGITVRVGSGSQAAGSYSIPGYPSSALIGPDGNLLWQGHPSELSNSTVESALKGAKPAPTSFLAFAPKAAAEGRVAAHAKAIEQGKLAKAHAALLGFAADAKATEGEKTSASALAAEIEAHVQALLAQAERFAKSREPLKSVTVYDTLAKEFGAAKFGTDAKAAAEALRKDEATSRELDAAEAFEKLRSSTAKLASSKRKDKYKEFAEKWKGTKAGDRAKAAAAPKKE